MSTTTDLDLRVARLQGLNWQAVAVVVTFSAMMGGFFLERFAEIPAAAWSLFAVAYLAGGYQGAVQGVKTLLSKSIDIDLLMVFAAIGAAAVGAPFEGALLLFLFSLSNWLQDMAMNRAHNAIRALMKLRPDSAVVQRDGDWQTVPLEDIEVGDVYRVRPGDRMPLDGQVRTGESTIDQSAITGESEPVPRAAGDEVLAGSINKNGTLTVAATKSESDSTLSRIIALVQDAQEKKAKTESFLNTFEQIYALVVIGVTVVAAFLPVYAFGAAWQPTLYRAITLMVAMSPCALIISTPAVVLSAIGNGARRGLLFKGGVYLEKAAGVKVVAFDKTGTLTYGRPELTDAVVIDPEGRWHGDRAALLSLAASLEASSEHALGHATVEAARREGNDVSEVLAFDAIAGEGVRGHIDGSDYVVSHPRALGDVPEVERRRAEEVIAQLQEEGKTSVVLRRLAGEEEHVLGVLGFADRIREDAPEIVRELRRLGVERIAMLTGDARKVADRIAEQVGIDDVYAELKPDDKHRIIEELEESVGSVAMVGDGVNDAPALARAGIGIAMGAAGTDVALETADIVLMADDLGNVPYVMSLSRSTRKTLVANLGLATGLILLMVAGILIVNLPLPVAVFGHEGGTVLVSLNGLRMLLFRYKRRSGGAAVSAELPRSGDLYDLRGAHPR